MKRVTVRKIQSQLERIVDRYLRSTPEERTRLVIQKIRLEEDLEQLLVEDQ